MSPISCALIGIGTRARKLYMPLAQAMAPWLKISAVCSPDSENAEEAGSALGVPAFASLTALLDAGVAEAAVVLSTIESHHAISVTLSRHGIHHLVETTMATTVAQAREMVAAAEENDVTMLVAENYFRFPFDRLAKATVASGAIGDVRRLTCYHDQVGFHGHARWIKFFDDIPLSVQAIEHKMPTERHVESARRVHETETFRSCYLHFPGERLALNMGGNPKGLIGRTARPGFTEIDGSRGAIVRNGTGGLGGTAELRAASSEALGRNGLADHIASFVDVVEEQVWLVSQVDLPEGRVEWINQYRPGPITGPKLREWDCAVVLEILVQFAQQVRGTGRSEFSAKEALAATEVEMACRESALRDGARIDLTSDATQFSSERAAARALESRFGIDHLDADAMVGIHFPAAA